MGTSSLSGRDKPLALVRELKTGQMGNSELLYSLMLAADPNEFTEAWLEVNNSQEDEIIAQIAERHDIDLRLLDGDLDFDTAAKAEVQS